MSDFNRYLAKEGLTLPESRALTASANRYMAQPDTISQPQQHDGTQMWNPTIQDYAEFGLGFTPFGAAVDAKDVYKGYQAGSPMLMGLGAIGLVPGIGDVAKKALKGFNPRIIDRLMDSGFDYSDLEMVDYIRGSGQLDNGIVKSGLENYPASMVPPRYYKESQFEKSLEDHLNEVVKKKYSPNARVKIKHSGSESNSASFYVDVIDEPKTVFSSPDDYFGETPEEAFDSFQIRVSDHEYPFNRSQLGLDTRSLKHGEIPEHLGILIDDWINK